MHRSRAILPSAISDRAPSPTTISMPKKKKPRIAAIFLAYNVAKSLPKVYAEFPKHLVDEFILVDDASKDHTAAVAKSLGIPTYRNTINLGYGGNLKRALCIALCHGADIIIDLHPDGEYRQNAIRPALTKISAGAQFVVGNRFTTFSAPLKSGMRFWKVIPMRSLNTFAQLVLGTRLNDLHQGFLVYTRPMLETIAWERNSNGHPFSFELVAQAIFHRVPIAEVPVATRYRGAKRGVTLPHAVRYALSIFRTLARFLLAKRGFAIPLFEKPTKPLAARARCSQRAQC